MHDVESSEADEMISFDSQKVDTIRDHKVMHGALKINAHNA